MQVSSSSFCSGLTDLAPPGGLREITWCLFAGLNLHLLLSLQLFSNGSALVTDEPQIFRNLSLEAVASSCTSTSGRLFSPGISNTHLRYFASVYQTQSCSRSKTEKLAAQLQKVKTFHTLAKWAQLG